MSNQSRLYRGVIRGMLVCLAIAAAWLPLSNATSFAACPFCSAINLTFWEQIKSNDIVVIAELTELPPVVDDINAELPKAEFEVKRILRGEEHAEIGMRFRVLLVGTYPVGQEFLVMGVNPPGFVWSTPLKATPRVIEYVEALGTLPEQGPERLLFFQKYFEDEESVLAFDAYDEFARAPYADLIAIKDRMDHDQLVKWILDSETTVNRRRLYFTMLGVCGRPDDVPVLEELIRSDDRKQQAGLDALVASYLLLKGAEGLPLVEEEFLKNDEADYVDTLATVSALRFHGTEVKLIPKDRLVAAIRTLLDRPKMADMIIPDLARWEDWSVMEKLVKLFKESNDETNWVRVPVIQYLQVCPRPEAKAHIEELRKIDPDAVARAALFAEIDFGNAGASESGGGNSTGKQESNDKKEPDRGTSGKSDSETSGAGSGASDSNNSEPVTAGPKGIFPVSTTPAEAPNQQTNQAEQVTAKRVPFSTDSNGTSETVVEPDHPPSDGENNAAPSLNEPETQTNVEIESPAAAPEQTGDETFTSDRPNSTLNESTSANGEQVVPTVLPPSSEQRPIKHLVLFIVFSPFAFGAVLFVLLWSVINGWFERLIF